MHSLSPWGEGQGEGDTKSVNAINTSTKTQNFSGSSTILATLISWLNMMGNQVTLMR
jgi:hypothetical protein